MASRILTYIGLFDGDADARHFWDWSAWAVGEAREITDDMARASAQDVKNAAGYAKKMLSTFPRPDGTPAFSVSDPDTSPPKAPAAPAKE